MRVNNNISAVVTNNQLLRTEDSLSDAMERLSSGLRINHSSDDPSGMAISGKMQAQIDGLDQASRNASDGISVLQTADGALNEVSSMLQRIRELAVQAANGTNAESERSAIQDEIESLKDEIDRVSTSTEFNTKTLLDGSLDTRVYGDGLSRIQASEYVSAGTYKFSVTAKAEQATSGALDFSSIFDGDGKVSADYAGTISINGVAAELEVGMTDYDVYQAMRNAAEEGKCELKDSYSEFSASKSLTINTTDTGSDAELSVTFTTDKLSAAIGGGVKEIATTGKSMGVSINYDGSESQFDKQTTVVAEGNKLTFTSTNGFEITLMVDELDDSATLPQDYEMLVTDIGPMDLQIGANEGQTVTVRIPSISTECLYIDDVDVTKADGPEDAMNALDDAINRLSSIRAKIGAYENRLDHAVSSLDETGENMTSALSRIEDVDMAEAMTEYTQYNVLQQAATSVLAQANELPQMALQLLQQ